MEVQAKHPAKKENFETSQLNATNGNNRLHHDAAEIVKVICAYQTNRDNRLFGNGNLGDPRNLFLEEIKRKRYKR